MKRPWSKSPQARLLLWSQMQQLQLLPQLAMRLGHVPYKTAKVSTQTAVKRRGISRKFHHVFNIRLTFTPKRDTISVRPLDLKILDPTRHKHIKQSQKWITVQAMPRRWPQFLNHPDFQTGSCAKPLSHICLKSASETGHITS